MPPLRRYLQSRHPAVKLRSAPSGQATFGTQLSLVPHPTVKVTCSPLPFNHLLGTLNGQATFPLSPTMRSFTFLLCPSRLLGHNLFLPLAFPIAWLSGFSALSLLSLPTLGCFRLSVFAAHFLCLYVADFLLLARSCNVILFISKGMLVAAAFNVCKERDKEEEGQGKGGKGKVLYTSECTRSQGSGRWIGLKRACFQEPARHQR